MGFFGNIAGAFTGGASSGSKWYDWLPGMNTATMVGNATGNGSASQMLGKAYNWAQQKPNVPQIPQSPYLQNYNTLIGQLEQQSRGEGPSLAGNAYRQAHGQAMNDYASMSNGGSAGNARMAQRNMGSANANLQAGYSNARLQEQLAARQMLQGALSGANAAWFQPQQTNLAATMGSPTNMQQLTGLLQQLGMVGGMVA